MTVSLDPPGKHFGVNPVDWRFASRVNIGYQQHVGIVEGAGKFIHQISSARISMGLEQDYYAPVRRADPGRAERGFDLCRMMPVVVDHGNPGCITFELKAPIGATEFAERMRDRVKRHF